MTLSCSQATEAWVGTGSTSIIPPPDYWAYLARTVSGPQLKPLQQQSDSRLTEFTPSGLPTPLEEAILLLDRVAADGWLNKINRHRCPNCKVELSAEGAAQPVCPECNQAYSQHGGVTVETVYVRELAASRSVDWVVAIHGMNTSGTWQEAFSWLLGTTWGQSVPVAVYKYGIVIAGVIMAWRRRKLQSDLRGKIAAFYANANTQGFSGKPDVIAHSFGTWLFGHILESELTREPKQQLKFGRIILTGCILRPDYNWKKIKEAGLVDDVLNHYGTKDIIVPLAHVAIWDSGPSGRRGFDGDQVLNIRAEGYGHSDLFSIRKCVVSGNHIHDCTGTLGEMSQLEHSYKQYWRPFLTLPKSELSGLPDRVDPTTVWRQLPWLVRGTIFPFISLLLILALIVFMVACIGKGLWEARQVLMIVISICAVGLVAMSGIIAITWLCRGLRRLVGRP